MCYVLNWNGFLGLILCLHLKVDEVSFKKPVDIGDLLRLKSRVLHTTVVSESEVSDLFLQYFTFQISWGPLSDSWGRVA